MQKSINKRVAIETLPHYKTGFSLLILYLLMEYGSIQNLIPMLGYLRPGILIIGFMGVYLLHTGNLSLKTLESKCILGFLLLSAIHIPFAVNNYWAFQGFRMFLIYLIVFLSITTFINSYERLKCFINLWIGINIICALIGLKHGGKVPFSSFMGDENDFALVMNMAIPFAYFMFLRTDSLPKKIIYLSACGLFIAANVTSLSRSGFVGLVPIMIYCWLKTPKKILATIIIAILIGSLYYAAPPRYWDEVRSIKEENIKSGTGEERWYQWKIGWKMFLDHPIIGVGPGNYPWHVGRYESHEGLYGRSRAGRSAHSLYFTFIPEFGIAGIILFSMMLYHFYNSAMEILKNKSLSNQKDLKFINHSVNGAMVGFLFSGIFLSVFYYPHFWFLVSINGSLRYSYKQPKNMETLIYLK